MAEIATLSNPTNSDTDIIKAAASVIEKMIRTMPVEIAPGKMVLLDDAIVNIDKGLQIITTPANASRGQITFTVSTNKVDMNSDEMADIVGLKVLNILNGIPALRDNVILSASPAEYMTTVKNEMGALLSEAKKLGIEGSGVDYAAWKGLDASYSGPQIADYAVDLSERSEQTSIRIQIPTNSDKMDEAMAKAKEVADKLRPVIKQKTIDWIKKKGYIPGFNNEAKTGEAKARHDEIQTQLDAHHFDVTTSQDGAWTNVTINIHSPLQMDLKNDPSKTADPETLKKSNMFSMIPDQKQRFKAAGRVVLFEGKDLKDPSNLFLDVAGSLDMKTAVAKVMKRLTDKKPELTAKVETLLKENPFMRHQQWNLPNDKREELKAAAHVSVDNGTLKVFMTMPKGKASEALTKIAAMGSVSISAAGIVDPRLGLGPSANVAIGAAIPKIVVNPAVSAALDGQAAAVAGPAL